MPIRRVMTIAIACGAIVMPASAYAQDAAETAVILSGTSGQAKASRSLGDAVRGSINSASSAVRASTQQRRSSNSRARRSGGGAPVVIGTGDALENTDASSYTLGSGATIRVSGRLNPSAATRCTQNCDDPAKPEAPPEE